MATLGLNAGSLELSAFFARIGQRDFLGVEEKVALAEAAEEARYFRSGEDIVREGDRANKSTLLTAGFAMRYTVLSDGRRQITAIHVPGDFIDLHSFLLKEMDHSVGCLSDCRILTFPHAGLEAITRKLPHLTRLLWLMTLLDAAIHREWLVGMGRLSAVEQMAHLLCELFVRLQTVGLADGQSFLFPITQVQLADTLGISAVHVFRVLTELKKSNLILWEGTSVTVLDWLRLQALGEFDSRYLHLSNEPR